MSDTYLLHGKFSYDPKDLIGRGANAEVFRGTYKGEESRRSRYIILELCSGTLQDVCEGKFQGPAIQSNKEVVHQIIKGLDYTHSNKFIHGDIKPETIFISKTTHSVKIELSNFLLRKHVGSNSNFDWMAPELQTPERVTDSPSCDIFSVGCVVLYYVTRGTHPFGDLAEVKNNIRDNRPLLNIAKTDEHSQILSCIAQGMIEFDPSKRTSLKGILSTNFPVPWSGRIKKRSDMLGTGGFSVVFHDCEIAIQSQLNHENVLKILAVEENEDFSCAHYWVEVKIIHDI
ncbi:serine/threonine-protein kinase/endoribonuclease IRE1-like [Daphnia pulex]|uniref:serine/threonine-protein kinase/endoribonuclease IRE1-like n=1 Tax=Daphnia pulex TaxID=6669 RepID=UPI001EE14C33|nr:serine/threonine-protein kinase/endoribonuclease IRE1-like [Daphnia pulex]